MLTRSLEDPTYKEIEKLQSKGYDPACTCENVAIPRTSFSSVNYTTSPICEWIAALPKGCDSVQEAYQTLQLLSGSRDFFKSDSGYIETEVIEDSAFDTMHRDLRDPAFNLLQWLKANPGKAYYGYTLETVPRFDTCASFGNCDVEEERLRVLVGDKAVAAVGKHFCALTAAPVVGALVCWGGQSSWELGISPSTKPSPVRFPSGTYNAVRLPTLPPKTFPSMFPFFLSSPFLSTGSSAVKLFAGGLGVMCYLTSAPIDPSVSQSNLLCNGRNAYGLFGLGDVSIWEALLDPVTIPTPEGRSVLDVSAQPDRLFVLLDNGRVYGAGYNEYGNLGESSFACVSRLPVSSLLGAIKNAFDAISVIVSPLSVQATHFYSSRH